MTLTSYIIKLYKENLEHAKNICNQYSRKFFEHERLEFLDAVDEGLIRGINRYLRLKTKDSESYLQHCIWSELNRSCALIAASIIGFGIPYCKSQKRKGKSVPVIYSLEGMLQDLDMDVEHSRLTKLDHDDPYILLAKKDDKLFAQKVEKLLLKELSKKELDSVVYTYKNGFKKLYPDMKRKQHDNLQNRTMSKLKILMINLKKRKEVNNKYT